MAGLALGSLFFGRWVPRMRDYVSAYRWTAVGIALARLGARGEALESLERGVALDPGDARLRDTLAAVRTGQ